MVNEIEWIQCENCCKWRLLPPGLSPDDLPEPCIVGFVLRSLSMEIAPVFEHKLHCCRPNLEYAEVDEANWQRRLDVIQSRLPAYIELLNEQDVSKLTGPQARSASCIQSLRKNASLKAGATLQQEIIAVVRPKAHSCTSPTPLEQKYVFTESMEMSLEVCQVKLPLSLQVSLDEIKAKSERKHETKVTPSAKGGLRGLYCFRLAGTELESFLRTTGTYVFIFTLRLKVSFSGIVWCRRTDELVDGPNASRITPTALDRWEDRLEDLFRGQPHDMLDGALADTVTKFPVDIQERDGIQSGRPELKREKEQRQELAAFVVHLCYRRIWGWLSSDASTIKELGELLARMQEGHIKLNEEMSKDMIRACGQRQIDYYPVKWLYFNMRAQGFYLYASLCNHIIRVLGKGKRWFMRI